MKKIVILTLLFAVVFAPLSFAKVIKHYYGNGKLQSVVKVNDKGVRNGPYKTYWANGKLKETGVYKNGQLIGKQFEYNIDGVLMNP